MAVGSLGVKPCSGFRVAVKPAPLSSGSSFLRPVGLRSCGSTKSSFVGVSVVQSRPITPPRRFEGLVVESNAKNSMGAGKSEHKVTPGSVKLIVDLPSLWDQAESQKDIRIPS